MKGTFKIFFFIIIFFFILWIDIPESIKDKYNIPKSINIFGFKKEIKTSLGLDLKGGSHLVFDIDTKNIKKEDLNDAIESARDIIEKRVNFFGISEPTVQTLKTGQNYRIVVDLPGIKDVNEAIKLIGKTAQLVFMEEKIINEKDATPTATFIPTELTGKDIKKASVIFSQQDGKPEVALLFNDKGAKLFAEITKRNIKKPLAIVIDNQIITAPIVQQEITDGNAVITGNFNVDDAKKLAISINSGALPVNVKLIEQKDIGPSLGEIEVKKSVYAGIVGLIAVLVFMILYYGKLGIIASLALIIYGAISLAIFKLIPVTLTLPGVAGFILSIGMAVDSNILIFERIKEELRKGKDLEIAIKLGFGRAIDAIKDANITTLTVAFILFNPANWEFLPQFGMVRGFALTLAIGVATSLFTGVVITKKLIELFYKSKK
ncbi:MAG: protein translocase subunit SecD [Patescibacteria group bacterium]|nr:MAG: protein translocase subunit SecD [Patescibacteria group bacterium]